MNTDTTKASAEMVREADRLLAVLTDDQVIALHNKVTMTVPDAVEYLKQHGVSITKRAVRKAATQGNLQGAKKDESGSWTFTRQAVDRLWSHRYKQVAEPESE